MLYLARCTEPVVAEADEERKMLRLLCFIVREMLVENM